MYYFFLLLIPLIILLKISYLDMKFRILLFLNFSSILIFFISTKAGGRISIIMSFIILSSSCIATLNLPVNNFDFGKLYLILVFLITLFKIDYFYYRFYFLKNFHMPCIAMYSYSQTGRDIIDSHTP